jgi:DNA polymerase
MDERAARALRQRLESLADAGVTALPRPGRGAVAAATVAPPPADPAPASGPAGDAAARSLAVLQQEVADCTRCVELAGTRTQTVFGSGSPAARLCFLGEAPGADEDASGAPFVGRAGQLLTKIIEACTLSRDEVYILNVLKCRPPGNRLPAADEVANCRGFFERQLAAIAPEFICCLGSTAAQALLRTAEPIGRLRRRWFSFGSARVLCTYHPSYLLRNPAAKRDVWEDMQMLMREMGLGG